MSKLPLEGIRVIDHGIVYTGTAATTMLADMGAEVIRVESIQLLQTFTRGFVVHPPDIPGPMPGYVDGEPGEKPWERWFQLHGIQRNKYGITLDLTRPKGVEIYKKLAAVSDIVMDNFAAGVMDKLGIGYSALKEVKPDIIMVSASGFGSTGPYKSYVAVGTSLGGMTGLMSLRGYPQEDMLNKTFLPVWSDNVAAGTASFAALTALHYRNKTGKGQFVDLAQSETFLPHMGESILDFTMNGRVQKPIGNRHPMMAPHGCYPCKGDDNWVTIAVNSNEEWEALCRALGDPEWSKAQSLKTVSGRLKNQDELDEHLSDWTAIRDKYEVMNTLQKDGVPSGPVVKSVDLYNDSHLKEREFFKEVSHKHAGVHNYPGMPFKFSKTPAKVRMPPNGLGEHNDYVYGRILGMSDEEIALLEEEKYIGNEFLPEVP